MRHREAFVPHCTDCKQQCEAERLNSLICSRHLLWEKCVQLVSGAQGYIHAPESGLFDGCGMGLTPLPQRA